MKVSRYAFLFFVVAVIASHADETNLTLTVDGVTYSNVTFGTVTPSSVSIRHKTGAASVPLWKLSPELQQRFGYDPVRAAEREKAEEQSAMRKAQAAPKPEEKPVRIKASQLHAYYGKMKCQRMRITKVG